MTELPPQTTPPALIASPFSRKSFTKEQRELFGLRETDTICPPEIIRFNHIDNVNTILPNYSDRDATNTTDKVNTQNDRKPRDFEGVLFGYPVTVTPKSVNTLELMEYHYTAKFLTGSHCINVKIRQNAYTPAVESGNKEQNQEIAILLQHSKVLVDIYYEIKSVSQITDEDFYKIIRLFMMDDRDKTLEEMNRIIKDKHNDWYAGNVRNHNMDGLRMLNKLTPKQIDIIFENLPHLIGLTKKNEGVAYEVVQSVTQKQLEMLEKMRQSLF